MSENFLWILLFIQTYICSNDSKFPKLKLTKCTVLYDHHTLITVRFEKSSNVDIEERSIDDGSLDRVQKASEYEKIELNQLVRWNDDK